MSVPDWIRTNDLPLRRRLLYPAELQEQYCIAFLNRTAGSQGIEPWSAVLETAVLPLHHEPGCAIQDSNLQSSGP